MKVPNPPTGPRASLPPNMGAAGPASPKPRRPFVQVVSPRLRPLLLAVLVLFSLLAANSAYLGGVTLLEWYRAQTYQDWFYQIMFLAHLVWGSSWWSPSWSSGPFTSSAPGRDPTGGRSRQGSPCSPPGSSCW